MAIQSGEEQFKTNPKDTSARGDSSGTSETNLRRAEREEVEEMKKRGTLTPESHKQGVTSHLPADETEYMYRSEDDRDDGNSGEQKPDKSA
jgi:hypothetical protein